MVDIHYRPMTDLSAAERADLTALSQAVFSPEVLRSLPGRDLEWSAPEGRVFIRSEALAWSALPES